MEHFLANEPKCPTSNELGLLDERLEDLTSKFTSFYKENLTLNLEKSRIGPTSFHNARQNDVSGNRNHAMRFSFEKLINSTNKNQTAKATRETMNPLMEVDEEEYDNEGTEPQRQ